MPPATRRVLISDNFNRANAPTLGANWDEPYDPGLGFLEFQLLGNEAAQQFVASTVASYIAAIPNDQWGQVRLTSFDDAGGSNSSAVTLRMAASPTLDWYQCLAAHNIPGITTIIGKRNAGAFTTIASEGLTAWAPGDLLSAEIIGTTLTVWRNGVLVLTGIDGDFAAGRVGMACFGPATPANQRMDDFQGEDFVAASIRTGLRLRRRGSGAIWPSR